MTIEEQRKKLKSTGHNWGDKPRQLGHHVYDTNTNLNADKSLSLTLAPECTLHAMSSNDTKKVVQPISRPQKPEISTAGWTLDSILQSSKRFRPVKRVPCDVGLQAAIDAYEKNGIPLIVEGWHKHEKWPKDMFSIDSFSRDDQAIIARNVHDRTDHTLKISELITKCRESPTHTFPEELERLYGKDAECPELWRQWLQSAGVIPSSLLPDAPTNLLHNLPASLSVETLMCYLGIGDTFTPCHKDLCASSGQNLMCYTENGGSSFWFMTKSSDAPHVSEWFHTLNQELDHETHVLTVQQLAEAPFTVYVAEQILGDLVLVPPRSCHQVVNFGGITLKTSWSRMTLKGLAASYYHELPIYRRVCRPEIYQVKATIYHTLRHYTKQLQLLAFSRKIDTLPAALSRKTDTLPAALSRKTDSLPSASTLLVDMKELVRLFDDVLIEEYSPDHLAIQCLSSPQSHAVSPSPSSASSVTLTHEGKDGGDVSKDPDDRIVCDFCGGDIFQSFFECNRCVERPLEDSGKDEHAESYAVCAGCYVEGRSCPCGEMDAKQRQPFDELLRLRRDAFDALSQFMQENRLPSARDKPPYMRPNGGVFRAARVLEQTRKDKRETKACRTNRGDSHCVPFPWALSCKKCHAARCFQHLLDQRVHSADAILLQTSGETHMAYHDFHVQSKSAYENALQTLLKSQQDGIRPNQTHNRVYASLAYRFCKPAKPSLIGWYDTEVSKTSFDSSRRNLDDSPKPSNQISSLEDFGTANPSSRKRKRCVMDHVLVPAASYSIRRKLSHSQPLPNVSKPAATEVLKFNKPSMKDTKFALPQEKRKISKMYPIPRRKPASDKLTASGSLSLTEGDASPRREARKPGPHSSLANQSASPERARREGFPRKDSRTVIDTLRFKKSAPKADDGSQSYSLSSPSSSSSRSSSSSTSFTADRGGSGIAQALNHATANNNHSYLDTDVLMSNSNEPRPVFNHTGSAEKIDDVKAQLADLQRELTELKTTVFNSTMLRNTSSVIHPPQVVYCIVPSQGTPHSTHFCPPDAHNSPQVVWPQGNYHYQAPGHFNQGPPFPNVPLGPRFNGRSQQAGTPYRRQYNYRNDNQRSDQPFQGPNRRPRQSQDHSQWRAREPKPFSDPSRYQTQGHSDGCLPGRSISHSPGECQDDRAEGFSRAARPVQEPSTPGQSFRHKHHLPDVHEREGPSKPPINNRSQKEASARTPSISADQRYIHPQTTHTLEINVAMDESTEENGGSPQPSHDQWEDGYEQEDPPPPTEKFFKPETQPSGSKDNAMEHNPWK